MSHHKPFSSLSPIDWASVPSSEALPDFLRGIFADTQTIIDSIPLPQGIASAIHGGSGHGHGHGRARANTDPSGGSVALNRALSPGGGACAQTAKLLHKEWKEVKTNPRDNPLAINVYKLSAKDGKGAWFARRGIYEGVPFDKFRLGLEREFSEALKARVANPNAGPGAGNVRGIGAEKRAECVHAEGIGMLEVYQLSAQFPGPTTPRDFVTLLLTSAPEPPVGGGSKKKSRGPPAPRQFMIVSKPCVHPECAPRQGYIRGQYESVEIIREIPVEVPLRKVRSSIDLNRDGAGDLSKAEQAALGGGAIVRSARKATAGGAAGDDDGDGDDDDDDARSVRSDVGTVKDADAAMGTGHETEMAVEWLMVTRSDPGGSVPRFMVEKGTPGGIVSDAGRLLDWLASKSLADLAEEPDLDNTAAEAAGGTLEVAEEDLEGRGQKGAQPGTQGGAVTPKASKPKVPIRNLVPNPEAQADDVPPVAPATGLYSMITGVIGVAGSAVASRIPFGGSMGATDSEPELDGRDDDTAPDDSSDASSVRTFNSAMESPEHKPSEDIPSLDGTSTLTEDTSTETLRKAPSSYSKESESSSAAPSRVSLQHDKDLRKLHERRRKVQDKMAKLQERSLSKQQEDRQRDEQATAKLREKHEREVARQEDKYRRELRKIEERRAAEEKKAAERRRKQLEREEKASLALELEHARAELDVALKQVDLLKDQIGELQSQNTMLVATLGKHGLLKGGSIDALSELKRSTSSASARSMRNHFRSAQ
ncbi:hypothetical protein RB600_007285 [Gaeumannomyces tritici]